MATVRSLQSSSLTSEPVNGEGLVYCRLRHVSSHLSRSPVRAGFSALWLWSSCPAVGLSRSCAGEASHPLCSNSIANGLMEALDGHSELSSAAARLVNEKFLWRNTAESYISAINKIVSTHKKSSTFKESISDFDEEIKNYFHKCSVWISQWWRTAGEVFIRRNCLWWCLWRCCWNEITLGKAIVLNTCGQK